MSKLCGEVKSKEKDKTASTPLVTVSDLQRLQQYETISLRLRTMPFKTKLVPNYEMDWGRTYEKATYPERKRQTVELFDIREFVKDMKKKKMAEMMGNQEENGMSMPGSMMGGMSPMGNPMTNPMFGSNPFAMNNPFASSKESPISSDFNVDDLVKRIDAKIAELEEEERREKESNNQELSQDNQTIPKSPKETITIPAEENQISKESQPISEMKPKESPVNETINIAELSKESNVSDSKNDDDDDFFDDFFSDE